MKRTLSFKNKWLGLNPKSCTRQNIRVSKNSKYEIIEGPKHQDDQLTK